MRVENKPVQKKLEKFIPAQPMGKIVILGILVIVSSVLFWLAWHNALVTGLEFSFSTQNIMVVVTTLLAFCLMFTFLAVTEVVVTKNWIELIITILSAGTIFLFFKFSLWSFVSFLLVMLGFMYWRREVRLDAKSRTKFVPTRIISAGLRPAVTVLLLAISFVYYSNMVTGDDASARLTESLVDTGTNSVNNVLDIYFKEKYDPDMTLDEFLLSNTMVDGENIVGDTGITEIDEVIRLGLTEVQDEALEKAREELLNTFEITATGDETMDMIVGKIVRQNIDKYIEPYKKFIPALLAVSLFFILSIFRFVYSELIKSFSYLIFHILLWLKFIKVEKIQIEAEKITL